MASDEAKQFRSQAPAVLRLLKLPLKVLRRLEKLVHGGYRQHTPFSYAVYTDESGPERARFQVDKVSVRWPD